MIVSRKRYEALVNSVKDLNDYLKGDEYKRLKADSEELNKIKALLLDVRFKVKDVKKHEDGSVVVRYELPTARIKFDSNGEPIKDPFFYATNYLEMISYEDMRKIQDELNKVN